MMATPDTKEQNKCEDSQNDKTSDVSKQKLRKPFKCEVCSKGYKFQKGMRRHLLSHTAYKCEVCNKTFYTKKRLRDHVFDSHGKRLECQICNASFARASALELHERTHTGEAPFKCDVCSFRFSSAASLKAHLRTHTGEKPFVCDQCTKGFGAKWMLTKHMKQCFKMTTRR